MRRKEEQGGLNKTDVIESCSREKLNTKWRFYNLTNLSAVFAALLKDVLVDCKDKVLPQHLLKNRTIKNLTFEERTRQPYNDNLCLFRAPAFHLRGNQKLEEEASKNLNLFINGMYGLNPLQFQVVHINDITVVEDILHLNIFLYEIENVDGKIIDELVRLSVQKYGNAARLLRYNIHICYVGNINPVFQSFRCPNCDIFFNKTSNLERLVTSCTERVKHVHPKNFYQIGETLFDKLNFLALNTRRSRHHQEFSCV